MRRLMARIDSECARQSGGDRTGAGTNPDGRLPDGSVAGGVPRL